MSGPSPRLPGRKARVLLVLLACLLTTALLAPPASATKTHLILEQNFGSAAKPTFAEPVSVAVDRSSGDLLVADASTDALRRFHQDGTADPFSALATNEIDAKLGPGGKPCAEEPSSCDATPQDGFNFGVGYAGEVQIAVDNSGTATDGDIYVTQGYQEAGNLVDVFAADGHYLGQLSAAGATGFGKAGTTFGPCGVAVDDAGELYVGGGFDDEVYRFHPSANPPLNTDLVATYTGTEPICNLAAGAGPSAGALFANTLFTFNGNSVFKLDAASLAFQGIVDPGEGRALAVDPSTGHLFVAGSASDEYRAPIREFDAAGSGASLISISTSYTRHITGMGAAPGRLYVATNQISAVKVLGPLLTVPDVTTGKATITGSTSVTLDGEVNPDGTPLEECRFEYGPTEAYGQSIPCAETPAEIGIGPKQVHADLSGLTPESHYHFRLIAANANAPLYPEDPGAVARGADAQFRTPAKPALGGTWSADVGLKEATLKAEITPENSPTAFRFEWGLDTSYGHSSPDVPIGSGEAPHTVSLSLRELQPATTYHYRVVAENAIGSSIGPDRDLRTFPAPAALPPCPNDAFRSGPGSPLPDCRAYELVSPLDKNGGDVTPPEIDQATPDGEALTYSSPIAFGQPAGAPGVSQYIARRGEAGWSSRSINAPRESPSFYFGEHNLDSLYKGFSEDLCSAWMVEDTDVALAPGAPEGLPNLYRRDNCGAGEGEFELLTTAKAGLPSFNPEEHFVYFLELQGFSGKGGGYDPASDIAVFRAPAALTPNASSKEGIFQLYAYKAGQLHLVSLLPEGSAGIAAATHASLGTEQNIKYLEYRESSDYQAVSEDGSRVFWSADMSPAKEVPVSHTGGLDGLGPLYVRVDPTAETQKGKCKAGETGVACTIEISGATATRFIGAAADGSRAVYQVGEELLEFDVDKALAGKPAKQLIAKGVRGVVGTSKDAKLVYLVSSKALSGGQQNSAGREAEEGQRNLYLYRAAGGSFTYVATLAGPESSATAKFRGCSPDNVKPSQRTSRVSADGEQAAFCSTARLTEYDNADAESGQPDAEVYLYDANAGEFGELICASCNPSGERPTGRLVGSGENGKVVIWHAAQIPTWTDQLYPGRALSAGGHRLFFESFDPLVLGDTDGAKDVYEWEAPGTGSCTEANPAYFPQNGGCLYLISSGRSPQDSQFIDASADGRDAFFSTNASLLPQDPGLIDIYDARVNGGFPEATATADCEGEACQSPPEAPNDLSPASSTFAGAGNVPALAHCRKGKVRRRGHCLKRRHRKKHRHAHHRHRRQHRPRSR